MTNTETRFVTNIKKLRELRNLKRINIAHIFNMQPFYYNQIEEGGKEPTLRFITKLSAFYNIPIYELFKEDMNIYNQGITENVEDIFAENLILYRKKKEWTYRFAPKKEWTTYRLAKEIGVTSQYLYKLEKGTARRLKFEFLEKLASKLDIEVYQLFMPVQRD